LRQRHQLPPDRGAAAVEFALVLPLLFLLLFGIIQYGYGFFQLQAAQATAHEAVRRAALGIDDCDGTGAGSLVSFDDVVTGVAEGNGMALDDITRRRLVYDNDLGTDDPPQPGDSVQVEITYTPGLDFPLIPYPETITRRASTTVMDVGGLVSPLCDLQATSDG